MDVGEGEVVHVKFGVSICHVSFRKIDASKFEVNDGNDYCIKRIKYDMLVSFCNRISKRRIHCPITHLPFFQPILSKTTFHHISMNFLDKKKKNHDLCCGFGGRA